MSSKPDRKARRLQTADVSSNRRRVTTRYSLRKLTAREQTSDITESRGCQLEPEGHADNELRSVDEDEQVAQHSSVGNSSCGPRIVDEDEQVAQRSSVSNRSCGPRIVDEDEQVAQHSSLGNCSDGPRNVDEGEQIAEHSSVSNSSCGPRSVNEGEQVAQHSSVRNSINTKSMSDKTANRKRNTCQHDTEEISSEPDRKLRRLQTADVSSNRRHVTTCFSLRRFTAREQTAPHCPLESEGHADNEHRSVNEGEQIAEHSSVDNSSDGPRSVNEGEQIAEHSSLGNSSDGPRSVDEGEQIAEHSSLGSSSCGPRNVDEVEQVAQHSSVDNSSDGACSVNEGEQVVEPSSVNNSSDGDSEKCPVCSATFTTQQVATPDACEHIFCAACLQELSRTENNCPVDKKLFNFILVRHHLGGEIVTRIPVGQPERQGECSHEDGQHQCCEYILGHGWTPVLGLVYLLTSLALSFYVLPGSFPH
jgi:hypothetical protein